MAQMKCRLCCAHMGSNPRTWELLPPSLTHRLSLSVTHVVPPCKQGSPTSPHWLTLCGWGPKLSLRTTPRWWHGSSRQAQAKCRLHCPPIKTRSPHPHECSQSFFPSELRWKSGTLLILLRDKQGCFRCLNLHKIPIDLESEHFPKYTYYKMEERNPRDRRKTLEIQKPQLEP